MTRHFHIGDILSITDGRVVSPRLMAGVQDIMEYMAGMPLATMGLVAMRAECVNSLLGQHPQLAKPADPDAVLNADTIPAWLAKQVAKFGETLPVEPLRGSATMRTVYKYTVPIDDTWTTLDMPTGAWIVHVGQQQDPRAVVFWAEVPDTTAPTQQRTFRVYGTGHEILEPTDPAAVEYLGTVQSAHAVLVWHLYEHTSPEYRKRP